MVNVALAESEAVEMTKGELSVPPIGDPQDPNSQIIKDQTHDISKLLRCLACHGLSVADSRSDGAIAMKARVKELLSLGYTQEQIIDYFVDVYGEWILLKPDSKHWFLIAGPVVVLLIGLGVAFGRRPSPHDDISQERLKLSDEHKSSRTATEYRRRILEELEND